MVRWMQSKVTHEAKFGVKNFLCGTQKEPELTVQHS